ncbi:MAG: penicillin-insensitive murein endopeptidase [Polyangiaceae bacterium]|nr:penicillin-insensitive murein endopeptidase [Polyangiaceae bacterium]MCW5790619.1 penicillin-insensitive murein endopeptidase [Polyangiaceae bacterium]
MRLLPGALFSALLLGCGSVPTPLAPGLEGSVGVPHDGVQTGALELPRSGPGFVRYRPWSKNYWGRPELVRALIRAAETVTREHPGGAPLVLGDLSAEHGGKIPNHRSHRTGRDVDLLWYLTTPDGAPVPTPGFVRVGSDGLAQVEQDFLALDIPRMWALVRALLSDAEIGVQWLFVSQPIEALLIEYAMAKGEPDALVWYAQTVLHQPRDSAPHDDHIHMRIACSPSAQVSGCQGGGPAWEFLPPPPALELSDDALMTLIAAGEPPPSDEDSSTDVESAGELVSALEHQPGHLSGAQAGTAGHASPLAIPVVHASASPRPLLDPPVCRQWADR